ncbi:4-nitrophenylphosphatase [Talaromyces stipitatus ATCC 10500]|uniref:4-nitrophenylphosphatase n=1 Tax=Talaromyces stipitatus (strain ATCC 10500 / CBS 375.48 / QM 6759 / NRRL 1006) TaxID=441959 RepID=B8MT43_TALSN|nr:4-nitrophenylphosphatase [Talaromyces stipitatus ATCC 10500]EED12246.1 4-nitrophenylphosphatase [Talaromyces stipitatus ATCC 10500]
MSSPLYKKALIIGATSGIGEALAIKLISHGSQVVLVGRRQERLDNLVKRLGSDKSSAMQFDILKLQDISTFASKVTTEHPDIDAIILNSGIQRSINFAKPETVDMSVVQEELTTNYTSIIHLTMAFLPFLQAKKTTTHLVYISATLGIIPTVLRTGGYNASKAALHHWILVFREQLRQQPDNRVKVVEVFPPAVQTELHDERHQPDLKDGGKIGMPLQEFIDQTYEELLKGDEQFGIGMAKATIDGWEKERVKLFHHQVPVVTNALKQFLNYISYHVGVGSKSAPGDPHYTMTTTSPQYLTGNPAALNEFIDRFDTFLFDCDGVLWSGDHTFPGTAETLELLRSRGKQVVFVTNNSTKSRADYKKKLDGLGIPSNVEEIFSSSYSASIYISRILKLPADKPKVFVIGETGIEQELRNENVPFIGGTDPTLRRDLVPEDYKLMANGDPSLLDPEVGVVLVGLDFHINYLKLALAFQYIRRGAVFLATNIDSTLPNQGSLFPGAGSMSAPLIMMSGKEPTALGKPSQAMMDAIEGKFQFDRNRTCMVGDRTNTDIRFGIEGKLGGTLAVLTGVSTKDDVLNGLLRPAAYVDKLSDLLGAKE